MRATCRRFRKADPLGSFERELVPGYKESMTKAVHDLAGLFVAGSRCPMPTMEGWQGTASAWRRAFRRTLAGTPHLSSGSFNFSAMPGSFDFVVPLEFQFSIGPLQYMTMTVALFEPYPPYASYRAPMLHRLSLHCSPLLSQPLRFEFEFYGDPNPSISSMPLTCGYMRTHSHWSPLASLGRSPPHLVQNWHSSLTARAQASHAHAHAACMAFYHVVSSMYAWSDAPLDR